jgi:RNA polymerase sigma factor (sigma-70 family)
MGGRLSSALAQLRRVVKSHQDGGLSDAELLQRFVSRRDEAAFEVVVWRHGPMVLGVANRALHNTSDSEDVLQATFLALVRQAKSIGAGEALASWLYRVAYRTALRVRLQRQRQFRVAAGIEQIAASSSDTGASRESLGELDEELHRLPEKYRTPLILSYLEGLTNQEIARQVACPVGTVFTRLARGRALLRKRLARREIPLTLAALSVTLASSKAATPLSSALVRSILCASRQLLQDAVQSEGAVSSRLADLADTGPQLARRIVSSKYLGLGMLLLVFVASTLGLLASRAASEVVSAEAPPAAGAASTDNLDQPAKPAEPAEKVARPKVVQVFPADGATDVDPITEIRIRFDRPMDPVRTDLQWDHRTQAGFRPRGDVRYDAKTHEFIFPVELSVGCKHELRATTTGPLSVNERDFEGFRDTKGIVSEPYHWSFTTLQPTAKPGPRPRVTSVTPASDTEVALLTPVEITFDKPMDPLSYGLAAPDVEFDKSPELLVDTDYNAKDHRFTLLIALPPNWNGELRLDGFRGKDGTFAEPVLLKYRTLHTVRPQAVEKRIEVASKSAELRHLLERIRKARRELHSVSEALTITNCYSFKSGDRYQVIETRGVRFQMDGNKYLGIVDDYMRIPFRIGSDGETCWYRSRNEICSLPAKEVHNQYVQFCDPFGINGTDDLNKIIRDEKLEYLGDGMVHGRRCYRIRSWTVNRQTPSYTSPLRTWFFDAESLLPVRIEKAGSGEMTIDFALTRVNKPIPAAEFRPESGPDLKVRPPDKLSDGYNERFLTVIDGSPGSVSLRWGETGEKKRRSGGLN